MAGIASLWTAPEVNPITGKARSIPFFNLINVYGRVFFFSWLAFFLAFWSWFAFPPLLSDVIAADIGADKTVVLNSNVIGLVATLAVRLIAGPACDIIGPRLTFAACLLIGSIPTFLAGTIQNAGGLYAIRFFVGILGGSFVPCQVWSTQFFDKNIVGTSNAIAAGLGNAGGGVTYFAMPAIYESLVGRGLASHVAWRVSFVVPGILIVTIAILLLVLCPDTPTGRWADRHQAAENNLRLHGVTGNKEGAVVEIGGGLTSPMHDSRSSSSAAEDQAEQEKKLDMRAKPDFGAHEAKMGEQEMISAARGEVIQKPSASLLLRVMFSPATLVTAMTYFCTFGTELAVNGILGNYIKANFPSMSLQTSGNYAAIFGLLNIIARPLGGVVSDFAYSRTKSPWSKKALMHSYAIITGVFLIVMGRVNPKTVPMYMGLINGGIAFFLEGGNGLVFSLVPHVHPQSNGVVSGMTGAFGNLGGIAFALTFRFCGADFARAFWIIGVIVIGIQLALVWIPPTPKGQIGGR